MPKKDEFRRSQKGVLLNADMNALEAYKRKKSAQKEQAKMQDKLNKIDVLESRMSRIEQLLEELVRNRDANNGS